MATSAAPEIILLCLICVVLLADLLIDDENRVAIFWLIIVSLFITGGSLVLTAQETRTVLFDGSYVSDPLSLVLKLAAVGVVAIGFMYSRDYLQQNKLFKGEYPYNRDIGIFAYSNQMIENPANLHKNDALILSYPFSGTGTKHDQYEDIMERCDQLDIPVLLDCAWLGSAKNQEIDVNYEVVAPDTLNTTKKDTIEINHEYIDADEIE